MPYYGLGDESGKSISFINLLAELLFYAVGTDSMSELCQ